MPNMNWLTTRIPSIRRRTRLSEHMKECCASVCSRDGVAGLRSVSNRSRWSKAERSETRKGVRKSDARQDPPCHVVGLSAWPALRPDFAKPGIKSDALCSLQDYQWVL